MLISQVRRVLATLGASLAVTATVATSAAVLPSATAMVGGSDASALDAQAASVVRLAGCTGVALNDHWLLTAAHCGSPTDGKRTVWTGLTTSASTPATATSFVPAPTGDLALMYVPDGLGLSSYATLPQSGDELPERGSRATGYGWGKGTGSHLATGESTIQGYYRLRGTYNYGQMFVVSYDSGTFVRPGDSGGPLFVDGVLHGITSSIGGAGDSRANYSAVLGEIDWIRATIAQGSGTERSGSVDDAVLSRSGGGVGDNAGLGSRGSAAGSLGF